MVIIRSPRVQFIIFYTTTLYCYQKLHTRWPSSNTLIIPYIVIQNCTRGDLYSNTLNIPYIIIQYCTQGAPSNNNRIISHILCQKLHTRWPSSNNLMTPYIIIQNCTLDNLLVISTKVTSCAIYYNLYDNLILLPENAHEVTF